MPNADSLNTSLASVYAYLTGKKSEADAKNPCVACRCTAESCRSVGAQSGSDGRRARRSESSCRVWARLLGSHESSDEDAQHCCTRTLAAGVSPFRARPGPVRTSSMCAFSSFFLTSRAHQRVGLPLAQRRRRPQSFPSRKSAEGRTRLRSDHSVQLDRYDQVETVFGTRVYTDDGVVGRDDQELGEEAAGRVVVNDSRAVIRCIFAYDSRAWPYTSSCAVQLLRLQSVSSVMSATMRA